MKLMVIYRFPYCLLRRQSFRQIIMRNRRQKNLSKEEWSKYIETMKLLDIGAEKVSEYQRVCSQEGLTGFIRKVCNKRRRGEAGVADRINDLDAMALTVVYELFYGEMFEKMD